MICLVYFLCCFSVTIAYSFNSEYNALWETYKVAFNKTYTTYVEEQVRRQNWEDDMQLVRKHNSEGSSKHYSFNISTNHLSDKAFEEYLRLNGFRITIHFRRNYPTFPSHYHFHQQPKNLPRFIDWRQAGVVTAVKNQGRCGSCWAITAVESLEGQMAKKTGKLVPLSAQNLLDCAHGAGARGCIGGNMDTAFKYIRLNHGVDTEASYPYIGRVGYCHFKRSAVGGTLRHWVDVKTFDEIALMKAVARFGPVAAGVNALCYGFKQYKSGIYDVGNCNPVRLNHAVLVVGYGTTASGIDYWIVKNSWSRRWGENGYMRIRRNKNQCGIASLASFPLV